MTSAEIDISIERSGVDTAPGVRSMAKRRIIGAVVAGCCAAVLAVALWLSPSSDGLGTHQQLNLPTCGWITLMDVPCITCGMTTAYSHAVRGRIITAILTQPLGGVLALATAMVMLGSIHVAVTGARMESLLGRLWSRWTLWLVILFALASWAYKIVTYKELIG